MGWILEWRALIHEVVVPLAAALALGAALGWEREWRQKPAGLRTHMLVSLGAAAFTLVTLALYQSVLSSAEGGPERVDPLRIVEGVIGGIGFLGAGAIIRDGGSIEGLTTAGTVWLAGAVGLACGTSEFVVAAVTAVLAIAVLSLFGRLERSVLHTK